MLLGPSTVPTSSDLRTTALRCPFNVYMTLRAIPNSSLTLNLFTGPDLISFEDPHQPQLLCPCIHA